MYAHVTNGTVDSIGTPPEKWFDGTRWWDLRTLDPATLATAGWYLVTETTRPNDTASTKYVASYTLTGSNVTQSWVATPKTADEIAQDTASANYSELLAKIPTAIANNITAITNLQTAVSGLTTIAGQTFANQTQRDNALKSNSQHSALIGQQVIAALRQNNATMRIIGSLLDSTTGT